MVAVEPVVAFFLSVFALCSLAFVLWRYQTVLFGFTIMAYETIAVVSLSGFLVDYIFGLKGFWITTTHLYVFTYSAVGLMAFAAGVFIAWRPLATTIALSKDDQATHPWLNPRFAYICFAIGIIAQFLMPLALRIPTVRAAWSSYYEFLKLGMLVCVIYSRTVRNNYLLVVSILVFFVLTLFSAVLSGHIGIGGTFLFQLLIVGCFWKCINLRTLAIFSTGILFLTLLMIGWLSSRDIIRSGSLNQFGAVGRSVAFLQEFDYVGPDEVSPQTLQEFILLRSDMSSILAAQASLQPEYVPYAYGETIYQNLIFALVPRVVWPNKPIRLGGSEFVSRYSGLTWSDDTSVGLPYQFELYANGGALAVVAGLFFVGWLIAKMELLLYRGYRPLPHFLGLFILVCGITGGSQTIVALVMQLVAGYIATFLLGKLLLKFNVSWHFWYIPMHVIRATNLRRGLLYKTRPVVR